MEKVTITTVCLGNICRSPLMEKLVLQAWEKHPAGPPRVELVVVSAGLNPMLDYATQETVLVGRELGVELVRHRSQQVTAEHAATSALLLTATAAMKESLHGRFPEDAPGRTFSMGEYAGEAVDIEDPYGRTMARYRDVAQQIHRYAGLVIARFIDELRDDAARDVRGRARYGGGMKIYTKTGDDGTTGLFGGGRVSKDEARVDAYGNVDELNAVLGQVRALLGTDRATTGVDVQPLIERIQIDLFVLGAELASNPKTAKPRGPGIDQVAPSSITALELTIDRAEEELPLTSFILPGGGTAGAALHHARVVCRRAERRVVSLRRDEPVRIEVVHYLNRLSDLLFVLACLVNHRAGAPETKWLPGT